MGTATERDWPLYQRQLHSACRAHDGIDYRLSWRFDFEETQDFHLKLSSSWLR